MTRRSRHCHLYANAQRLGSHSNSIVVVYFLSLGSLRDCPARHAYRISESPSKPLHPHLVCLFIIQYFFSFVNCSLSQKAARISKKRRKSLHTQTFPPSYYSCTVGKIWSNTQPSTFSLVRASFICAAYRSAFLHASSRVASSFFFKYSSTNLSYSVSNSS